MREHICNRINNQQSPIKHATVGEKKAQFLFKLLCSTAALLKSVRLLGYRPYPLEQFKRKHRQSSQQQKHITFLNIANKKSPMDRTMINSKSNSNFSLTQHLGP